MRVFVFFIYLCLFLLRGNGDVHAGSLRNGIYYSHTQDKQHHTLVKYINCKQGEEDDEKEYFDREHVEEEDSDNVFARKYKLLTRCYLALSDPFNINYFYCCFKDRQPPSGRLSHKYIVQRVLRI